MLIVTISYYDDIVMLTITIMITIGYHDNRLITTEGTDSCPHL